MTVDIDTGSGFCYGVVRAIGLAEETLQQHGTLYSLGDIVHNEEEVCRLSRIGLKVIDMNEFEALRDASVLIRAHGEPPSTYALAARNRITLLDATCPVVLHLQRQVRRAWLDCQTQNGQIVIYGKPGHAEVNGLVGQTDGHALVAETPDDLGTLHADRPIHLFAQTTQSIDGLHCISQAISRIRALAGVTDEIPFTVHDTICRQVANRVEKLIRFAGQHDIVLFVGGLKSSNGRFLFETCRQHNPRTCFVSRVSDLQTDWFRPGDRIGICGATSTPQWLMNDIAAHIRSGALTANQGNGLQPGMASILQSPSPDE